MGPTPFEREHLVARDPAASSLEAERMRGGVIVSLVLSGLSMAMMAAMDATFRAALTDFDVTLLPILLLVVFAMCGTVGREVNSMLSLRRIQRARSLGSRTVVVSLLSQDAKERFTSFEIRLEELASVDPEAFSTLPPDLRWRFARDLEVVSLAKGSPLSGSERLAVDEAARSVEETLLSLREQTAEARLRLSAHAKAEAERTALAEAAWEMAEDEVERAVEATPLQRLLAERDGTALDSLRLQERARKQV